MARKDWGALLQRFLSDHAATGISPRDWCTAQGLNYNTAKDYIKIKGANSGKKSPNKTPNSGKAKSAKSRIKSGELTSPELAKNEQPPDTKRNGRRGNPNPANQFTAHNTAALKHGGYARRLLLSDEVIEDAKALTLDDELFRLRASNLVASENIGRWKTQLEDAEPDEIKGLLEKISAADKAMMRNTVRIESITGTLATVGKIYVDTDYRCAATEKVILEAERLQLELAHEKKTNGDDKPGGPQIIINLVNSPDGD